MRQMTIDRVLILVAIFILLSFSTNNLHQIGWVRRLRSAHLNLSSYSPNPLFPVKSLMTEAFCEQSCCAPTNVLELRRREG
jgi:hypothetical protein